MSDKNMKQYEMLSAVLSKEPLTFKRLFEESILERLNIAVQEIKEGLHQTIFNEANWIQKAIKHPGSMTKAAKKEGVSNSEYEEEHKHDSGKAGERARLALNLKKMNKD